MLWSSRKNNKPNFIVNADDLLRGEWIFASESARMSGLAGSLDQHRQSSLAVRCLTEDVIASLEIDGEVLEYGRVETAVRRSLGLTFQDVENGPAETGAASLAIGVLQDRDVELTERMLGGWRQRFEEALFPDSPWAGAASPGFGDEEFRGFLRWYNRELGEKEGALLRAGLAHLWFESLHPFGAATGVVGRALAERMLACSGARRNFVPLSTVFCKYRHEYHRELDGACRDRDAGRWLLWFGAAAIEAGRVTRARLEFVIGFVGLMENLGGGLKSDQESLLRRLFWMGEEGMRAGLGKEDGDRRDLLELVERGALAGVRKGGEWRYRLNLASPEVARVYPEDIL